MRRAGEVAYPGTNPLALKRAAASGPVRNLMSSLAGSGDLLAAPIPAVKTVILAYSPGRGPTSCAPVTGTISEPCATPSSASPLATTSAAWAPWTNIVFAFICSAIPRRSRTRAIFFQAEDGIRDSEVTGVQTCALPICPIAVSYLGVGIDTTSTRQAQPVD